jgi:hypothetical protein
MSIIKQIACIGAYAMGFAVGTYGACKVVKIIEKKFPMQNNPLEVEIRTSGRSTLDDMNKSSSASHGGPLPAAPL